jgi:hypothetical protein
MKTWVSVSVRGSALLGVYTGQTHPVFNAHGGSGLAVVQHQRLQRIRHLGRMPFQGHPTLYGATKPVCSEVWRLGAPAS